MVKKMSYILLGLFVILPMVAVLYLSVVQQWVYPQLWRPDFTLRHWATIWSANGAMAGGLVRSLGLALSMSVLGTLFGFMVSRQIANARFGSSLLRAAYYPFLIAPVILGLMLQFYWLKMGLSGSFAGVMLAQFIFVFPYSVLIFSTFWNERIRQISHQATTLGASSRQVLVRVLLPLSRPWVRLSLIQCFLLSWYEYGLTKIIGLGKVSTLPIQVMNFVKEANPHAAAVASCLMILPVVALFLLNRTLIQKSMLAHD